MGDPRRLKKKYKKPKHPYQKDRMMEELEYVGKYGLRNKREFWKMRSILGEWRQTARYSRTLLPKKAQKVQQTLLKKLTRLGVLSPESTFEDILQLTVEDVLKRRLQTFVFENGMAKSIYHARQLVVHKHIQVADKRINSPSYIVKKEEEDLISFSPTSPFATAT
ncbi:MAG: 30S ribosomal protein S4 [Candidatus Lokiarchaeota archaeon]|nr:30S ribosomal protein S4 [Candidatus Lokiarchaeota archaeon]MBD3198463.1 30S ribosomal protein S4 [Candidatus Lokiarchaeota archaeon]